MVSLVEPRQTRDSNDSRVVDAPRLRRVLGLRPARHLNLYHRPSRPSLHEKSLPDDAEVERYLSARCAFAFRSHAF